MLATLGGASPTGLLLIDVVYTAGAGAALAFAGGRSRRLAWLLSSTIALWVTPSTLGRIVSILAIVAVIHAVATERRRVVGALVGAALALVLGDLGAGPFHGATMLYAAVAAAPILISGARRMPAAWRRPVVLAVSTATAAAGLATLVFGLAALLSISDVGDGVDAANRGFDDASDGNQTDAGQSFDAATAAFERARGKVSGFWTLPARLVPVVAQQVRAIQVTAAEGVALSEAATDTALSVDPDDVRFVDGRLDLELLDDLQPVLDRAERALDRAHDRITETRSPWLVAPLADRMDRLLTELDDARPSAEAASLTVTHLPEMLGADGPVHWLVALTTPAEARGLGGLLGNWVLVRADAGAVEIVRHGRNEDVNAELRAAGVALSGPEQYVERWGSFRPNEFFQDVTLSPDLPMVATVTADLFAAAMDETVDGVIVLDPYALQAVLELGGPVQTGDRRLTADTLIPFLLTEQYVAFAGDEAGRALALGELVEGAFESLTRGALPGPRAVTREFGPIVEQDRLGVWWRDGGGPTELIDVVGLDGAWPDTVGADFVGLVHQNAGQNKLDTHLERELAYDVVITDGVAEATITATLHNRLTDLSLPDAIVASNDQAFARGTNVVRLGIHTGLTSRSLSVDGVEVGFNRQPAFGGEVATVIVEVPAGETRVVELQVAGTVTADADGYRLVIPHQPLVNQDLVSVSATVDGRVLDLGTPLTQDRDLLLTATTD
ncbi:MAG: DUF4012 domain-containing protein [Acidimicrobiales bacterium]|nr:DUF4012 domain-containing protein [Acidimicrobiales bacterium]